MRAVDRPILFPLLLCLALPACNPIAERVINKRKMNAQNLVSVYASAMAAGADLSKVKTKHDAIELIRHGVYGAHSFATTLFTVPHMTDKEAKQASRYILLDASGQLTYSDQRVP